MNWKDIVKNHQEMLYYSIIFCILILAAVITWYSFPQSSFDELLKNYSQYKIAIIAASASGLGIMMYIGNSVAMKVKYHFIEVRLDFKNYIVVIGSLFLIVIAAVYFTIKHDDVVNVLFYIVKMGALAFFLGSATFFNPYDNKRVTLKMFTCDESGGKKLEIINDLELYQITSKDYRFKDSNNGKNFIVPIGQIQAIESQESFNTKEQPAEKVMEHGNKMKDKEEIRRFAEKEFRNDLDKTYEQLGIDSYDEIFQEDRNLPDNTNEQIRLLTLDCENMKHAMKRMFAFLAKAGRENQTTQRWIQLLTLIIAILTLFIAFNK